MMMMKLNCEETTISHKDRYKSWTIHICNISMIVFSRSKELMIRKFGLGYVIVKKYLYILKYDNFCPRYI